MYSYTINGKTHEFDDLPSMRKSAYGCLRFEGDRMPLFKDGEPYGRMHMLDDGVWIYTESDKEYRRVRAGGTVVAQ